MGGPTSGIFLVGGNFTFYLPHSGLSCFFGTTLRFQEGNQEGRGFLPDLWVEPTQAMNAVKKLVEYYGLAEAG